MIKMPVTPAAAVHNNNQKRIYQLIRHQGSISRADLVRQTDLTFPTISRIVAELLEFNMLQGGALRRGGMGKPPTELSINPRHAYSLGVHLDGDEAQAVLINALGEQLMQESVSPGSLADQLVSILYGSGVTPDKFLGVGVSSAEGEVAEEQLGQVSDRFSQSIHAASMIAASVQAERYFGEARKLPSFLYFDGSQMEVGGMIGSTLLARSGTLEALLGGADTSGNVIAPALRGAAALLQTETVVVGGVSGEDVEELRRSLAGLKVMEASGWASDPARAAASVPLHAAYSVV